MLSTNHFMNRYLLSLDGWLQESGNLDARLGPMRGHVYQQAPAQRGGRGNASRLQPVSRDASFGSGGGIPEAGTGGGTSGEGGLTAGGGSSSERRRSHEGAQLHHLAHGLRTGSFRFQVCATCGWIILSLDHP